MFNKLSIFVSIALFAAAVFIGGVKLVDVVATNKVNKFIDVNLKDYIVDYEDVVFNFNDFSTDIKNIKITSKKDNEKYLVKNINIISCKIKNDIPIDIKLNIIGISSNNNLGALEGIFSKIDYNKIDLYVDYKYDINKKDLDINDLTLKIVDGGSIKFKFNISDFDYKRFIEDKESYPYREIIFKEARISFFNETLIDNIISVASELSGVNERDIISTLNSAIDDIRYSSENISVRNSCAELKKFINERKYICLSLMPTSPVTFNRIMKSNNTNNMISLLNLDVSTRQTN